MNFLYTIGVLIVSASLLVGCHRDQVVLDAHALFALKCRGVGGEERYNVKTNMHDCVINKVLFSEQVLGD